MKAQEAIEKIQGQYLGTTRAWKGNLGSDHEQIYIVALADSLQTHLIKKTGLPPGGRVPIKISRLVYN